MNQTTPHRRTTDLSPQERTVFTRLCEELYRLQGPQKDPSHDLYHVKRVLHNALVIQTKEGGDIDVIIPAALLHDIVCHDKKSPERARSSHDAAEKAEEFLLHGPNFCGYSVRFPPHKIPLVKHAIVAHSSSANVAPQTLEAEIIFDADKLEFLGTAGIMRTFCSAGIYNVPLINDTDPLCTKRQPASFKYALDLFFTAMLKIPSQLHTAAARTMAETRIKATKAFLSLIYRDCCLQSDELRQLSPEVAELLGPVVVPDLHAPKFEMLRSYQTGEWFERELTPLSLNRPERVDALDVIPNAHQQQQ